VEQALPERLFELPEVGRLAHEGGAVNLAQAGEEMREVATEVIEDGAILGQAEHLADQFDCEDFTVGRGRRRAALAQTMVFGKVSQHVIKQAEGGYNEGVQVRRRTGDILRNHLSVFALIASALWPTESTSA
jgi:hypothetical protein